MDLAFFSSLGRLFNVSMTMILKKIFLSVKLNAIQLMDDLCAGLNYELALEQARPTNKVRVQAKVLFKQAKTVQHCKPLVIASGKEIVLIVFYNFNCMKRV